MKYDVIVIGAGSAGVSAAVTASALGVKVAIIEQDKLGGTCPNYGCVPSKALLASASAYRTLMRAEEFGLKVKNVDFDFAEIIKRKDSIAEDLAGANLKEFLEHHKVDVIFGKAVFASASELRVGDVGYEFDKAIIATGSRPFIPHIEGLNDVEYLTSKEVYELKQLPESMIIIGGSAVGLEAATLLNTFGCRVCIAEALPRIAFREDRDIALTLGRYLMQQGIEIHTGIRVRNIARSSDGITVTLQGGDEVWEVPGESVLLATGRQPNIDGLELEQAGIIYDEHGIQVDSNLASNIKHIFAVGDAIPSYQLAQAATYMGDIAGFNAVSDEKLQAEFDVIPHALWTYPLVASVGLTEDKATSDMYNFLTVKTALGRLGRAEIDGEQYGFVKILADAGTEEILGAHIIGHHADEIIHEIAIAMRSHAKLHDLAETVHIELTMADGVGAALYDLYISLLQSLPEDEV